MAIQVSYTADTGTPYPLAYARVESVQLFKNKRANIGVRLYGTEAATRGGNAPVATWGITVENLPARAATETEPAQPARPDWDDYFAVSGASTRTAWERAISTCYIYLKARQPEFVGGIDV